MESTETSLARSVLAHLIDAHKWDPSYAEKSARNFARLDPWQLADMPEQLKALLQPAKPLK